MSCSCEEQIASAVALVCQAVVSEVHSRRHQLRRLAVYSLLSAIAHVVMLIYTGSCVK